MTLSMLIARYGLFAVFAGALLEGETLLVLAGYAAHRGYLDFASVVAVAAAGAVLGDQFYFWLGRRHGKTLLARRPALARPVARALTLIERHPRGVILGMRFLWGLRTALPVAIGTSRVGWSSYLVLNVASALLWAPLIAGLGYLSGAFAAERLGALERYEHWGMLLVLVAAGLWHLAAWRAKRTRSPK